jgi:hypothetical protein
MQILLPVFFFVQPDDGSLISRKMQLALRIYEEYTLCLTDCVGRDNSADTATLYGMDGPGIESWWGTDFPHQSRSTLGPLQPPLQWVMCLFPGGKTAKAWR